MPVADTDSRARVHYNLHLLIVHSEIPVETGTSSLDPTAIKIIITFVGLPSFGKSLKTRTVYMT